MSNNKQVIFRKKLLPALAVILLISLFVIFFMVSRAKAISDRDANIIGCFIEWFGVLYGVLLALVVVEVWHRYSQINAEVDREADALVLLLKTTSYLKDKSKLHVLARNALEYSKIMLQAEGSQDFAQIKANKKLEEIHSNVGNILNDAELPLPLSLEILRYINDAIDLRGDWLARARERMPRGIWGLVVVTSLFWVLGFFGLNIESDTLAFMLCGISTFTVSSIIFIIADLDDPIGGVWRVRFESFELLQSEARNLLNINA